MDIRKNNIRIFFLCCLIFGQINGIQARSGNTSEDNKVAISIDKNSPMAVFGAAKIEAALQTMSITHEVV